LNNKSILATAEGAIVTVTLQEYIAEIYIKAGIKSMVFISRYCHLTAICYRNVPYHICYSVEVKITAEVQNLTQKNRRQNNITIFKINKNLLFKVKFIVSSHSHT
jgi:hypothetical protein